MAYVGDATLDHGYSLCAYFLRRVRPSAAKTPEDSSASEFGSGTGEGADPKENTAVSVP